MQSNQAIVDKMKDERTRKMRLRPKEMQRDVVPDDYPNNDAQGLATGGNTSGSEIEAEFEGGHGERRQEKSAKNRLEEAEMAMTGRAATDESALRAEVDFEGGAAGRASVKGMRMFDGQIREYASRKAIKYDDDAS